MRGGPPLIGCAFGAELGLSAIGASRQASHSRCAEFGRSEDRSRLCRYNRSHRRSSCRRRHAIRSKLRLSRRSLLLLPGVAARGARRSVPARCAAPDPLPSPDEAKELVVLDPSGPAFYFPGPGRRAQPDSTSTSLGSSPPRRSSRCRFALGRFRRRGDRGASPRVRRTSAPAASIARPGRRMPAAGRAPRRRAYRMSTPTPRAEPPPRRALAAASCGRPVRVASRC